MPNNKRIIFFDIDGTLLDHNKQLPSSAKHAILELKNVGHRVILATGRSPFMLENVAQELGINSYVGFNGQYVVLDGELIYSNPLSPDVLHQLAVFAQRSGHPLVFLDPEMMRSSATHHPYIETCIQSLQFAHPECDPFFYRNRRIYQTMLFCCEEEETAYQDEFNTLHFVRWHPFSLDVLPGGGSKARGIQQIMQRLNFDPSEAYAFGDNFNDMEMFQYIGHSVAMGNSPDPIKQIARYVTTNVDQDGIAHGLRIVGLLS